MIKAFKGFRPDMTCRGHQYEDGKSYETEKARACECGFNACEHPLDVLRYYTPNRSVYHEVELDGEIDKDGGKIAATKIKIGARLSIAGLVKAAIDFAMSRIKPEANADEYCGAAAATGYSGVASATGDYGAAAATGYSGVASATGDYGAASATGYCGAASATGDRGAASATGDCGAASATGDYGAASATGDCGAASATGDCGAASATGYSGAASATGDRGAASATGDCGAASAENPTAVAVAWGVCGRAKGVKGSHIVLADWGFDGSKQVLRGAKCVEIDGRRYKADTWYTMRDGKIVEVGDGE